MKILFYYLLYLIFLISSILYGSLYIGPVTPRQIMSVVMIVVCIKEGYLFLINMQNCILDLCSFILSLVSLQEVLI